MILYFYLHKIGYMIRNKYLTLSYLNFQSSNKRIDQTTPTFNISLCFIFVKFCFLKAQLETQQFPQNCSNISFMYSAKKKKKIQQEINTQKRVYICRSAKAESKGKHILNVHFSAKLSSKIMCQTVVASTLYDNIKYLRLYIYICSQRKIISLLL